MMLTLEKFVIILSLFACINQVLGASSSSKSTINNDKQHVSRLKMVSVIMRHGDRAPYTAFLPGDKFVNIKDAVWPNGANNLTDVGIYRQFSNGLKLREIYLDYLSLNPNEALAFSSGSYRCIKSVANTIKGLYNIEAPADFVRKELKAAKSCKKVHKNCLIKEAGFANLTRTVPIDTDTVPSLNYEYLDKKCAWHLANPSPIDSNVLLHRGIATLPSIQRVKDILRSKYNAEMTYSNVTDIWSQILNEMELFLTDETYKASGHFLDWVFESAKNRTKITLYDVLEEAAILTYKDRVRGKDLRIQNGPILSSIIDSYKVALNETKNLIEESSGNLYKNKKIVFYSTHDNVVMVLMDALNLLNFGSPTSSSYEKRFKKYNDKSDSKQYLHGIQMPSYGITFKMELIELEDKKSKEKLAVVRSHLYNKEDGKFSDIQYHRLKIGKACHKLFKRRHPKAQVSQYYKSSKFNFDPDYNCPFELFQNVTSHLLITRKELTELCDTKK